MTNPADDTLPRHILSSDEDIRRYLLGGRATITVLNTETGERRTIKVKATRAKVDDGWAVNSAFFVSVMTGSDNVEHYTYVGLVPSYAAQSADRYYRFKRADKPLAPKAASGANGFAWLWSLIHGRNSDGKARKPSDNNIGEYPKVQVWHEGRCGCCGRPLTVPESIARGIGPVCWDRLNG